MEAALVLSTGEKGTQTYFLSAVAQTHRDTRLGRNLWKRKYRYRKNLKSI